MDVPHLHFVSVFLLAGRSKKSICELVCLARSWFQVDLECSVQTFFGRYCVAEHGRTLSSMPVLSYCRMLSEFV